MSMLKATRIAFVTSDNKNGYLVYLHEVEGFVLIDTFTSIKEYANYLNKHRMIIKFTMWDIDQDLDPILRSSINNDFKQYEFSIGVQIETNDDYIVTARSNGYGIVVKARNKNSYYLQLVEIDTKEIVNVFKNVQEYIKFLRKNREGIEFTVWGIDGKMNKDLMYKLKKELEKYPNDVSIPDIF